MAKKSLSEILGGRKVFGLYTVIGEGPENPKKRMVECRCSCGAVRVVAAEKLTSGRSTRCRSCANKSPARVTNLKHGKSWSPEYAAWRAMRNRCTNPRCWNYSDYGGRGISVCDRWMRSFDAFYADMGPRPDGLSLDRIDNEKGYSPGNCRWADKGEQQRNRRVSRSVVWQGRPRSVASLERKAGLPKGVLSARLDAGWSVERAIEEPATIKKPRHEVFGEVLTTKQVCERYGVARQSFNRRLREGWSAEDAVRHYSR